MTSTDNEIAVYWDLDTLPAADAAMVDSSMALARALGFVTVHRALGSEAALDGDLAQALERRGAELLIVLPSLTLTRRPPLEGILECMLQDLSLRPKVGRVLFVSGQRDVAVLKRLVRGAGRHWLRLRGTPRAGGALPWPRPSALASR